MSFSLSMDQPNDYPGGGRPPRKELQGPRPTPLKVRKESHKIKKPPVAPPAEPPVNHPQPPRQPVIIYAVSPKVIHANPSEFMTLVQRLTGPGHSMSSSSSSFQHPPPSSSNFVPSSSSVFHHVSGVISPAARLASIEKTKMPPEAKKMVGLRPSGFIMEGGEVGLGNGDGVELGVERTVIFPGILSPGPGSIPPISPNFFSPLFRDPISDISYLHHDLNTVQLANKSYTERNYMPSPLSANFFSPSTMISPSSLDFLHQVLNS